jgi:hypothetical protein
MHSSACPQELQRRVHQRTGWRIRNLVIEIGTGAATLHGQASSYYARQLAQHVVSESLPEVTVHNAINVDHETEVLVGVPLN